MKVAIGSWRSVETDQRMWVDTDTAKVEASAFDIVVELIVSAERPHRHAAQSHYEWLVERKGQLIEEARLRKEEAERAERERLARLEQERIDRLLAGTAALRQAQDIRAYVAGVKALATNNASAVAQSDLQRWEQWALAQADRIDPVISGTFLDSMKDASEDQ